ncbi:MAG: single-stranded DNA-binding protein, partial [Candidatus Humimicrobiaceae bacterium]
DRVLVSGRLNQRSWEDKDGNKRSSVDIIANVVAPSLEFASCKINKNEKSASAVNNSKDTEEEADFTDEDIPF